MDKFDRAARVPPSHRNIFEFQLYMQLLNASFEA